MKKKLTYDDGFFRTRAFNEMLEEHRRLGLQTWRREKRWFGKTMDPGVTLRQEASRRRKLQEDGELWKEAEVVNSFFSRGWWLNPLKWFKAAKMRKRRALCTYMLTEPHMRTKTDEAPIVLPKRDGLFQSLIKLTKRISWWFSHLSGREEDRRRLAEYKRKKQKASSQPKPASTKKTKATHKTSYADCIAAMDQNIAEIRKLSDMVAARTAARRAEIAEEKKVMAVVNRSKALERQLRDDREICIRSGWLRRDAESDEQRRLRELQPTIDKLKAMIAMAWVCQVTGTSTAARIAAVLANHDQIVERNGLVRSGFADYRYDFGRDRRRHAGPEPEDSGWVRPIDPRIITEESCGMRPR